MSAPELIAWDAPGPYRVAFSTRLGGVSDGSFASLNLGLLTEDDPERVVENRRRLAAALGADPDRATMAWQQHGPRVVRAEPTGILSPGTPFPRCDGFWTDEPGQPMALVTADCLAVAICRVTHEPGHEPPRPGGSGAHVPSPAGLDEPPRPGGSAAAAALCVLHVGWRGLLAGIVAEGCRALGDAPLAAAIGPGIGPCCYDVGEEVAAPFRSAYGDDVVRGGRLDLWTACERALRAAGCADVHRTDLCTSCERELFFSHRRDEGRTGRQGIIGYVVER